MGGWTEMFGRDWLAATAVWVVATQIFFMFTAKFGEDEPILTNIFQGGWNHQLVVLDLFRKSIEQLR